ncbi:Structure-specific endonuclease subunit [Dirofilaria immitis]
MDDSDFIEKSLKSTRELKCKTEGKIISNPVIKSDYLLPGGDKDVCFLCKKDLKHLDELRKSLHINHCLDQQEACNKYETKKEKWRKVVDCPICGEPLEPGPFRSMHAKRCGKKHHINPNSLLLLLDTQVKVAEAKKRNGIAHTKLNKPKLEIKKRPNRLNEEPHSLFDEQMKLMTALSASMYSSESEIYTGTQELQEKLPKNKSEKQRSRLFSFVELKPRACKCEVIKRVQENFLNIFKTRDEKQGTYTILKKNIQDTEEILNTGIRMRELNCLKQLADDLTNFTKINSDVTVFSRENETFLACRFIIAARAPTLLLHLNPDGSLKLREYSGSAIRSYITFLTSASTTWTENEREEVYSLAVKYGPESLAALCKSAELKVGSNKADVEHQPGIYVYGNCDDVGEISNEEKIEEIEVRKSCSDFELKIDSNGKEKTGDGDLDDPSIIFVEEVGQNVDIVDVTSNMRSLLKECSESLSKSPTSEFRNSKDIEFTSENYSLSRCKKSSISEKSGSSEKGVAEFVFKPNNLFLMRNRVDSDASFSTPALPAHVAPHWNGSTGNLLKKLSPVKPLPSRDEKFLSPIDYCSRQTMTNELLDNLSLEEIFTSPHSIFKSGETRLSRKSLIKTKSSPEFSFIPNKSSSPLLSPLPLLGRTSPTHRNDPLSPEEKRIRVEACQTSTPEIPTNRFARQLKELGSNVKILKTKDITPMPVYDLMNDKELKTELAKFGVRSMSKKKAIALLKKIYQETHPVLESTPLSWKNKKILSSHEQIKTKRNVEPYNDENYDVDKTLNASLDECDIMEESCINDEQSAILPKELEGMQNVLLSWLRREENFSLYNHLLGLNVISFEEFADHLSRADSTVSQIPKKALIEILDRLHVTFRLPINGWDRKRRRAKK